MQSRVLVNSLFFVFPPGENYNFFQPGFFYIIHINLQIIINKKENTLWKTKSLFYLKTISLRWLSNLVLLVLKLSSADTLTVSLLKTLCQIITRTQMCSSSNISLAESIPLLSVSISAVTILIISKSYGAW